MHNTLIKGRTEENEQWLQHDQVYTSKPFIIFMLPYQDSYRQNIKGTKIKAQLYLDVPICLRDVDELMV